MQYKAVSGDLTPTSGEYRKQVTSMKINIQNDDTRPREPDADTDTLAPTQEDHQLKLLSYRNVLNLGLIHIVRYHAGR